MSRGPTTSDLLASHEYSSGVVQENLEHRIAVLEAVVARLLPQGFALDWQAGECCGDDPVYRAAGYQIHRWGTGWKLSGNGLEVEVYGVDHGQLMQQAQDHYTCLRAAAES